jgi:thermitase
MEGEGHESMIKSITAAAIIVCLCSAVAFADDVNVIVGFHGNADSGIFNRHGGTATADLGGLRAVAGHVPPGQLKALREEAGVAYVEEDLIRQTSGVVTPNDTYYTQYQATELGLIKVPAAWSISQGAGVRVAVLDTGCQTNHPDINGKVKVVRNFTTGSLTDVSDINGHGTHTAGTVGAQTNNGAGVAGVGYSCELAIGKVLGNSGSGSDSGIAVGINWAATTAGAKVISMSLGGAGFSQTLEDAINAAWGAGVVVVAAAGNDSSSGIFYPADSPNCIAVAATDATGALASFSNYGSQVDIAAPGVDIASTYKSSGYALLSGTSMACPHIAGVAALVWGSPWGTSAASVRSRIEGKATQAVTGANAGTLKLVDAESAVKPDSVPPGNTAPTVVILTPGNNSSALNSDQISFTGTASDVEDVGLNAANLSWSSSLDGFLGAGSGFTHMLSVGTHTITASATDSGALTGSASVTVTVTALPPPPPSTATMVGVTSISYGMSGGKNGTKNLLITATVKDNLGVAVANATVSIKINGSGPYSGTTGSGGTVTWSVTNASSGSYTTTVVGVTAAGLTWDGITPANGFVKP